MFLTQHPVIRFIGCVRGHSFIATTV